MADRELQALEIGLAGDRHQRCDEVLHQRLHDSAERSADDDGDRQVHDVAAQQKGLEVLQHGAPFSE